MSLAGNDVRRRSSAINLDFDSRKHTNKNCDEPILLCKEAEGYLFFSMTSDGTLNYKVAGKVQGSMSRYLVDPKAFNREKAPVVVLSSPPSGQGLAIQTYSRLLLPILKHFRVAHSHIVLKDESTASYLAANGQFIPDTIFILISGDGVIHEVVNGLATNPHFSANDTPIKICPIPTGTGNGLSTSLKISNLAQGIRAIFKDCFQPLPVLSVEINGRPLPIYATVVVSYGLHASLIRDCASPEVKARYGNNRFQEMAKRHLYPSPYLYQADLKLLRASKFPEFSGPEADTTVGDGEHTYCLFTRCSNLESDWNIAPLASPFSESDKFDVVRMGNLSGADLGTILMDAYKSGAQINRRAFEYYRVHQATLGITETANDRRVLCIDGVVIELAAHDQVKVSVSPTVGPMATRILVQKL